MMNTSVSLTALDQAANPFAADPPAPPSAFPAHRRPSRLATIGKANLLLAGLFTAGIACIYLLSLRQAPMLANADQQTLESQVDMALLQFGATEPDKSVKNDKAMAVVDRFYYQARQRQVPLSKLHGNAFIYRPPQPSKIVAAMEKPSVAAAESAQTQELSDALAEGRKLMLQSVLMGNERKPLAMISNNLLTEGQTINGWTVGEIQTNRVTLKWRDQKIVLTMSE